MGQRVMAVGDPEFAIRARRSFVGHQEGDDAGLVGLESDRHHVGHHAEVLGEIGRDAVGLVHVRVDLRVVLLGAIDLAFYFADGREILVEFALVCRSEGRFELVCVVGDEVENAAAILRLAQALFRSHGKPFAEQALKKGPGIENRGHRLGLAAPGEIVGVGAGVAGVAVTGLAGVFHAEFKRREAGLFADFVRDQLIEGNAGLNIHERLLHLHAGEVGPGAAAVIAGAIEQGAAGVVRQVAELEDVFFEGFERLQRARQFLEFAFIRRIPPVHDHAVRHIEERHANRRLRRGRHGGRHRVQEGQGNGGGAHAPEECTAGKSFLGDHFWAISFVFATGVFRSLFVVTSSPRRDWNGRLRTTS